MTWHSEVQNLEPRTEDDFQPRLIVNLADLVSQSPSAVESESKHTRFRWKQNPCFLLPDNQHNRELKKCLSESMPENDRDDHVADSKNLCEKKKTEKEHKKRMRAAQARRRNAELQEVRDGLGVMDIFWIKIKLE